MYKAATNSSTVFCNVKIKNQKMARSNIYINYMIYIVYVHTYMHACIHAYTFVFLCLGMHTHTYLCIYIYIVK